MDSRDPKDAAVEDLLNLQPGTGAANHHAAKLNVAFGAKQPAHLPDFEKIRQAVLARRNARETERQRFRRVMWPMAVAALCLVAVGVVFLPPKNNAPQLQPVAITVAPGEIHMFKVADALSVHARSATNLKQHEAAASVAITADSLSAVFDFTPTERLRKVTIQTPHGVFSVVGTRFIIETHQDLTFLAVESGAVRVQSLGKDFVVRHGEFWVLQKTAMRLGKSGAAGAKLFATFTQPDAEPMAFVSIILSKEEKTVPRLRRVSVTLKTGTVVNGTLIAESGESVEMRAPAAGNQVLRFKKEEIAGMRYLK